MSDLRALIRQALDEDIGSGDVTTNGTVPAGRAGRGEFLVKQDIVLSGLSVAKVVFDELAERMGVSYGFELLAGEGEAISSRTVVARISGPLRLILTGERLALNHLMRLSGIATNTKRFVEAAGPKGPKILDTRKTTPLWRELEKASVRAGGGFNHRHALYDGVLIKDNHITAAGSVTAAIKGVKASAHHLLRIECEVTTLEQLEEALSVGVDALLLDNMDDGQLAAAVKAARAKAPHVLIEASGNMNPERISRIKDIGLDFISAGGLVHQSRWVDISLEVL